MFVDMDIDTKPEDIKFESRATPNGELVYTEDPSKRVSTDDDDTDDDYDDDDDDDDYEEPVLTENWCTQRTPVNG